MFGERFEICFEDDFRTVYRRRLSQTHPSYWPNMTTATWSFFHKGNRFFLFERQVFKVHSFAHVAFNDYFIIYDDRLGFLFTDGIEKDFICWQLPSQTRRYHNIQHGHFFLKNRIYYFWKQSNCCGYLYYEGEHVKFLAISFIVDDWHKVFSFGKEFTFSTTADEKALRII